MKRKDMSPIYQARPNLVLGQVSDGIRLHSLASPSARLDTVPPQSNFASRRHDFGSALRAVQNYRINPIPVSLHDV